MPNHIPKHSRILISALLTLGTIWSLSPSIAIAATVASRVTGARLNAERDIVLNVEGEGFDPLINTVRLPDGQYQITISAQSAQLPADSIKSLETALRQAYPAIRNVQARSNLSDKGFEIILESDAKLQAQIRSNQGTQIVIALIGPSASAKQNDPATPKQSSLKSPPNAEPIIIPKTKPSQTPRMTSVSPGAAPLETDWQTAYSKTGQFTTEESSGTYTPLPDIQPSSLSVGPSKASNGQPDLPSPQESDTSAPTSPLHLKKAPFSFEMPTEPKTEKPSLSVFPAAKKPTAKESINKSDTGATNRVSSPEAASLERLLARARKEALAGRIDAAELGVRHYLEQRPNDPEAQFLLADILLKPESQTLSEGIRSAKPDNARIAEARTVLTELTRSNAEDVQASIRLNELLIASGQIKESEALLSRLTRQFPKHDSVWFQQGLLYEQQGKPSSAQEAYETALKLDSSNPETHYRLSQVAMKNGQEEVAASELAEVLARIPEDSRAWKGLGYLAEQNKESKQAEVLYRKAMQPDAMLRYGGLLQSQGQRAQALAFYDAVAAIAGDDADLLYHVGLRFANLQEPQRAEQAFQRLLGLKLPANDKRVIQAKATLKQLNKS